MAICSLGVAELIIVGDLRRLHVSGGIVVRRDFALHALAALALDALMLMLMMLLLATVSLLLSSWLKPPVVDLIQLDFGKVLGQSPTLIRRRISN